LVAVAVGGGSGAAAAQAASSPRIVSSRVSARPGEVIKSKAVIKKSTATTSSGKASAYTEKATVTTQHAKVGTLKGAISHATPFTLYSGSALSGGSEIAATPDGTIWWAGAAGSLDRITAGGAITTYTSAAYLSHINDIISGPDGDTWVSAGYQTGDLITAIIERVTPAGVITTYSTPTLSEYAVTNITEGPGGDIWFTTDNEIVGELAASGAVTIYDNASDNAGYITTASDGALWITDNTGLGYPIQRITAGGAVTAYNDPVMNDISQLAPGPDGALWFYDDGNDDIGLITPGGAVTTYTDEWAVPDESMVAGPGDSVWFGASTGGALGMGQLTTGGAVTDYFNLNINIQSLWVTAGPGDSIWFTTGDTGTDIVGRFTIPAPQKTWRLAALGDSYSSGEGTLDYEKSSGDCHRGPKAWPRLLAASTPGIVMEAHLACSGATSAALAGNVKGQPDQIKELTALRPHPTLITMTMGGNDVFFSSVLADCYHHNCIRDGTIKKTSEKIAREKAALVADYRSLTKAEPGATVLIVGYPRIFEQDHYCGNRKAGLGFKVSELAALNRLATQLDDVIQASTAQAAVRYVNTINAFAGHELCTKDPWVFDIGLDHLWHTQEGGHPTLPGQRAIADIVRSYIGSHL
jgi:streptogramin lyase